MHFDIEKNIFGAWHIYEIRIARLKIKKILTIFLEVTQST